MASHRRGACLGVVGVALAVLVTACGAAGPNSGTTSKAPRKELFTLSLRDSVRNATSVACPTHTSAGAQCFVLVEIGHSPQLGAARVAPVLDVEYPQGSKRCGASHSFTEKLIFHQGDLRVRVRAPYLCLGVIGTTRRHSRLLPGAGGSQPTPVLEPFSSPPCRSAPPRAGKAPCHADDLASAMWLLQEDAVINSGCKTPAWANVAE